MSERHSESPVHSPLFEALEPRLLLSGFPTILELADHSTIETAQDLTGELVELTPGEGSFGVTIEGALNGFSGSYPVTDYYSLTVSGEAAFRLEVDIAENGRPYRYGVHRLDPWKTFFWSTNRTEDGGWVEPLGAGEYHISIRPHIEASEGVGYRMTVSVTVPEELSWYTPTFNPNAQVAHLETTLEKDDPLDAFYWPSYGGDVSTEYQPAAYGIDPLEQGWLPQYSGLPRRIEGLYSTTGEVGNVYATLWTYGEDDLAEPNDTIAEAIDVTAYLRDAPSEHPFADKIVEITGNDSDGTDDWYKLTLDRSYTFKGDLRNAAGEAFRSLDQWIVGPGDVYFRREATGAPDYYYTSQTFQEADDGGGFQPVPGVPGMWRVRLYPDGPHDEQWYVIPTPTDVFVHEQHYSAYHDDVSDHNFAASGYAIAQLFRHPAGDQIPVDIYAYEFTHEIGSTGSPAEAQPIGLIAVAANPYQFQGFVQVQRTLGEEDWFQFDLPWRAKVSVDGSYGSVAVYDSEGTVLSGTLDPGTTTWVSRRPSSTTATTILP